MKRSLILLSCLAATALACGDSNTDTPSGSGSGGASSSNGAGGSGAQGAGGGGTGGGGTGEWETLIEGEWSLDSGSEDYVCVVATVPEDMYISAFRPIAPLGTHHTVLTDGASGPDGVYSCNANTNAPDMIYGSGVGTMALSLPEGVAVRLEQGTKLLLNLHLFNTGGDTLTGTSGVEVRRIDESDVIEEANSVLAGTLDINIPAQSTATVTGHCTMPSEVTIFAVGPHMHQYGTHMTVTAETNEGDFTLLDSPYTFDDQAHYPLSPSITLQAGEQVRVDCTYNNPTANEIGFGDSSLEEMCFAGLFSYPANNGLNLICVN